VELVILLIIIYVAMAYYAAIKGYNPIIWFFAAIPLFLISLISLLMLPWAKSSEYTDDARRRLVLKGNLTGAGLVILNILSVVAYIITWG